MQTRIRERQPRWPRTRIGESRGAIEWRSLIGNNSGIALNRLTPAKKELSEIPQWS
jgi:hypothetical protein